MNRRAVLAGVPVAGLMLPRCGVASTPDSAVAAKYREWRSCFDRINGAAAGRSEVEEDALSAQMFRLADEILDIPSSGPLDLIYKLMAYTLDGSTDPLDGAHGHKIYAEARGLIPANVMSSI